MNQSDDIEHVPVPLTSITRERLRAFARAIGKPECEAAAVLLDELLTRDDFYNAAAKATDTVH